MKSQGGYTPKISGRPSNILKKIPLSSSLNIILNRNGRQYNSLVKDGQRVSIGEIIAETKLSDSKEETTNKHQKLVLPSPADGTVLLTVDEETDRTVSIKLLDIGPSVDKNPAAVKEPSRLTPAEARKILVKRGILDYFWSRKTKGTPGIDGEMKPKAIIINTVIAEPFRTRGNVILQQFWHSIIKGMSYLPLLLADYGTVEFILTHKKDPIVQLMFKELTGKAWVKFHFVDVKYPVENPLLISRTLLDTKKNLDMEDDIWIMDIQTVEAIGISLGKGVPISRRIVAMGGPAYPDPMHINVRIGTSLREIIPKTVDLSSTLVLRGGLFLGTPVDPETDSVGFDDDAFFLLPVKKAREFVSFVRPGFKKQSIFPNFMGKIDKDMSTQLRGELRPCIACGKCQEVCPVGLLPQIIHRYLYSDRLDEAQKMGLDSCIDCNLCTFVCTSKIELREQFSASRKMLQAEREGDA
jgi:Na(+)-translocating NADH:ubiquinone oxidoreductase A subunit